MRNNPSHPRKSTIVHSPIMPSPSPGVRSLRSSPWKTKRMYMKSETLELSQTFATRLANAAAIVRILRIFIVLRWPGGWPRACRKLTQTLLEVRHLPYMTVVTSRLHQLRRFPVSEIARYVNNADEYDSVVTTLQGTAKDSGALSMESIRNREPRCSRHSRNQESRPPR